MQETEAHGSPVTWHAVLAAIVDFLTAFWISGMLVATIAGGRTQGGFSLQGMPALLCFALIVAYFVIRSYVRVPAVVQLESLLQPPGRRAPAVRTCSSLCLLRMRRTVSQTPRTTIGTAAPVRVSGAISIPTLWISLAR